MNIYNILEINTIDNTLKNIKEINDKLNSYDYSIIDLDGNHIKRYF